MAKIGEGRETAAKKPATKGHKQGDLAGFLPGSQDQLPDPDGEISQGLRVIDAFPQGQVPIPPAKSLVHRAIICAGLARNRTRVSTIYPVEASQDILATLSAMAALGSPWRREENTLTVKGWAGPQGDALCGAAPTVIDCAASGSTLRFLLPLAALGSKPFFFTGQPGLLARPLDAYADLLPGAGVTCRRQGNGWLIQGPLQRGSFVLPGHISSQFVSGLLMALPLAEGDSEIHLTTPLESRPYVDLTLAVMSHFGVTARQSDPQSYHIPGGQFYRPANYTVEGDYSQAAYFLAAAALGQPVVCTGLAEHSMQGDRAILGLLQEMGAAVTFTSAGVAVQARQGRLKAITVDARDIPDLVPPLAALCCYCHGVSHIINAGRLRLKESDRLHALATELGRLGAIIQAGPDSLTIQGQPCLAGGQADAHNDHRIAMALAVAAIGCRGPVTLRGAASVDKSYPSFWQDFARGPKEESP